MSAYSEASPSSSGLYVPNWDKFSLVNGAQVTMTGANIMSTSTDATKNLLSIDHTSTLLHDPATTGQVIVGSVANAGHMSMGNNLIAGDRWTIEGNYAGNNGPVTFDTVLGGDGSLSDKLVVQGDTSGTTRMKVNNAGGLGALTPAMCRIVQQMTKAGHTPMYKLTPQKARVYYEKNASILDLPAAKLPRVEDFAIPALDKAQLPARLYAASLHDDLPVLLFFHGGGFTVGSIHTHDSLCRQLALRSGAAVVSLEYRLAPEHRFPVAVDDAWAACQWLHTHGDSLGLDASKIAVGGDSAGGTLAAVCAIMARDVGLPLALQVLFYPGTAAHQDTLSHQRFAENAIIPEVLVTWFFRQYIGNIGDPFREDWRFAPLLCDDLQGVAPAWFGLAECDPFIDEGIAYADRLRFAGVQVDLEIYQGVTHEFAKFG